MGGERDRAERASSPWEWAVAGLGGLLLVATLAFLLHDALTSGETPPDPRISVLGVEPQPGRYLVRLRVRNAGETTAARLKVTGTLLDGGTRVEEAETEFDYLPGRSSREAGLFFQTDPRQHRLAVQPRSYQQP